MKPSNPDRPEIGQVFCQDEEIAELSLLLPGWQASQLVAIASRQRMTAGQLLRHLIKTYLAQESSWQKHVNNPEPSLLIFEWRRQ
jgi:hypothetical protein